MILNRGGVHLCVEAGRRRSEVAAVAHDRWVDEVLVEVIDVLDDPILHRSADGDKVEQSNLGRQMIYRESDIGEAKARVAADFLRGLNPHINIISHERQFSANDRTVLNDASAVCEGSDSLQTKFLLNDLALAAGIPAFIAALGKDQGHTMLVNGRDSACYRCVFDELSGTELPSCASEGIISTFPAVVSSAVAHSAVMHLLTPVSAGTLWLFEKNHCRTIQIKKRQDCDRHQNEEKTDSP